MHKTISYLPATEGKLELETLARKNSDLISDISHLIINEFTQKELRHVSERRNEYRFGGIKMQEKAIAGHVGQLL